jgi:uncharacterized membrane protein
MSTPPPRTFTFQKLALGFVFVWFLLGGIAHFAFTPSFIQIVPPYVPFPAAAVYVSGFVELAGAAALLWSRTRFMAGLVLILLTICVTPANVFMWEHADQFPRVPQALLLWRLPFQLVLVGLISWGSRLGAAHLKRPDVPPPSRWSSGAPRYRRPPRQ